MKIAFFDFDGTITKKDSLIVFIRYAVGDLKFIYVFISLFPMLILFKLKLIRNDRAKEIMLSRYFRGWGEERFRSIADQFSREEIDKLIRKEAFKRIKWHQSQNHKVVIVSASLECWLKAWCDSNAIELLATKFEFLNGKASGKLMSKNCYGREKVMRIKESYVLDDYDYIYAYGDSSGDTEMLEIADEKEFKPFRV